MTQEPKKCINTKTGEPRDCDCPCHQKPVEAKLKCNKCGLTGGKEMTLHECHQPAEENQLGAAGGKFESPQKEEGKIAKCDCKKELKASNPHLFVACEHNCMVYSPTVQGEWEKRFIKDFNQVFPTGRKINELVLLGLVRQTLSHAREEWEREKERKMGMLKQWLNEDRITDPKKMVTYEDIEKFLNIIQSK
jgi:hypothetical protein